MTLDSHTNYKLVVLDKDLNLLKTYSNSDVFSGKDISVSIDILPHTNGNLYFTDEKSGIYRYDFSTESFEKIYPKGNTGETNQKFYSLVEVANGNIACTTNKHGVIVVSDDGSYVEQILPSDLNTDVEMKGLSSSNNTFE